LFHVHGHDALGYGESDEALHDHRGQALYNESVYVNFVAGAADPLAPLGGIMRVGLRPSDGFAELSLNLPLGDGSTVFLYERRPLDAHDFEPGAPVWRCGGMELAVVEPLRRWRLRFAGSEPRRLHDAAAFGADPGAALRAAPHCTVALSLDFEGRHPVHALSDSGDILAAGGVAFARDHYEQFGLVTGEIELDGVRSAILGSAFRDHSWGPRDWQAAPHSDFMTTYEADGSATVAFAARLDGADHVQGVRWGAAGLERVTRFELDSDYAGGVQIGHALAASFGTTASEHVYDGTIRAFLPLRHRSEGGTVRIAQVLIDLDGPGGVARAWADLSRPAG
jgi:hypothetical protein